MTRDLNRLNPLMPAGAYKTYQIASPLSTHWFTVSCEDAECGNYLRGWMTTIDERTELGKKQAHYIRSLSGRSFTAEVNAVGMTEFTFRPGQPCFQEHKERGERPELYLVKGGDHRGNPRRIAPQRHTKPEHWVEDFAEHQDKLSTEIEKG